MDGSGESALRTRTPRPGMLKVMSSSAGLVLASMIACRSDPAPLSAVLVTTKFVNSSRGSNASIGVEAVEGRVPRCHGPRRRSVLLAFMSLRSKQATDETLTRRGKAPGRQAIVDLFSEPPGGSVLGFKTRCQTESGRGAKKSGAAAVGPASRTMPAGRRRPAELWRGTDAMHKGRLEAFSDGVLAIIITIMVLEL